VWCQTVLSVVPSLPTKTPGPWPVRRDFLVCTTVMIPGTLSRRDHSSYSGEFLHMESPLPPNSVVNPTLLLGSTSLPVNTPATAGAQVECHLELCLCSLSMVAVSPTQLQYLTCGQCTWDLGSKIWHLISFKVNLIHFHINAIEMQCKLLFR
jgi:hypothetical protein